MKTLLLTAIGFISIAAFLFPANTFAGNRGGDGVKRQKVIDFEDELVEGINKRPLDSLSQISEQKKRNKKPHLYRKRVGFHSEMDETLRVLRYTQ